MNKLEYINMIQRATDVTQISQTKKLKTFDYANRLR